MTVFRKWGYMTMGELEDNFKSPYLKQVIRGILSSETTVIALMMILNWAAKKDMGYVIGGSMEVSRAMEKRYRDLGGEINYKATVAKILVENDRAVGVKLADGSEHRGDYVISAADGHATIFDMLEGKYLDDEIRGYYETMPLFPALVYMGLGVNRTFDDVPELVSGIVLELEEPLIIANEENKLMYVRVLNTDPTMAPAGKTALTVIFESDYVYWAELAGDEVAYKTEKEKVAASVIEVLDKRFPGLAEQVEMKDVATPVTFQRYTGNWQGSFEGWMITPDNMNLRMRKTLPGLDNFYMVGQWVSPGGGLPSGLFTGYQAIQVLCHRDKKDFVTTQP
jgi:phytoene dehydrogenase-like protein